MWSSRALLALCAASLPCSTAAQSLKAALSSQPSLSILHNLLHQFDLLDNFDSATSITLLAPTDDAYRALAKWGFNVSEVPRPVAQALLTYHVLDGEYPTSLIADTDEAQVVHTLLKPPVLTNVTRGAAVKLSHGDDTIVVESGLQVIGGVVEPDITFDNGVIHTLNSSMVLPHNISTTAELGALTEFLEAMDAAAEVTELETLQDSTFFIPHNAPWKKLQPLLALLSQSQLAKILQYHAVPGEVLYHDALKAGESSYTTLQGNSITVTVDESGQIYVNGAKIVRQDLIIYGGVAHIIDDVLIPDTKLQTSPGLVVQNKA